MPGIRSLDDSGFIRAFTACASLISIVFGLRWQLMPAVMDEMMRDGDAALATRVMDVMLKMVKLDIAALEKAYRS